MDRLFFREYRGRTDSCSEQNRAQQFNIGVTGLGRSAGTTFVSSSLAFYFASMGKSLTFCQCLNPAEGGALLYDSVAMDRRFANRIFHDVYSLISEGKPVRQTENMEKGINWILPTPDDRQKGLTLSAEQRARLVNSAKGEICVFDMRPGEDWDPFLLDMDLILAAADPLPSMLIAGCERFRLLKRLELSGSRVIWAVNRANGGISRRQTRGFLKTKDLIWIPFFDPVLIYADENACRFHWENDEIRSNLLEIFTKVSHG